MRLDRLQETLRRIEVRHVDAAQVRDRLYDAYARMMCGTIGESLAHVAEQWIVDADRDRLIDEARD